ncbi:hypothetical protein ACP6EK_01755 [Candidatus Caldatribacterium sp. SIUC1]|uniref:hypothetical protein n=1 Tax=Candidatus Caldatribacterium sp. SIUC1 TaxID=3418365 RepID=UPI003F68C974
MGGVAVGVGLGVGVVVGLQPTMARTATAKAAAMSNHAYFFMQHNLLYLGFLPVPPVRAFRCFAHRVRLSIPLR